MTMTKWNISCQDIDEAKVVEAELKKRGLLDYRWGDVVYAIVRKREHTNLFAAITKLRAKPDISDVMITLVEAKDI